MQHSNSNTPRTCLDTVLREYMSRWNLRADGDTRTGSGSLVAPVRTATGDAAVLKVSAPEHASEHVHLVLRRWGGNGAARLLRADPPARTILLERLDTRNLASINDIEACVVVASLYARLHVPALPQLPSVRRELIDWIAASRQLPRSAPIPHRLVEQVRSLAGELRSDPAAETAVHGDLHFGTVLGATRQPWLAIAPRPVNADPCYELAPMLWHRWDEATGARDTVRRRFQTLVDAAALDEDRARAWTLIRVVRAWTGGLITGTAANSPLLSRYATVAKAVQD